MKACVVFVNPQPKKCHKHVINPLIPSFWTSSIACKPNLEIVKGRVFLLKFLQHVWKQMKQARCDLNGRSMSNSHSTITC